EGYEFLPSCGMHGQLQSSLDSFRSTVREVRARGTLHWNNLIELLRQIRHQRVVIIRAAHVNQLRSLVLNRGHDFRMTMTRGTDRDAGVAIEEHVAIDVFDPDALGALCH